MADIGRFHTFAVGNAPHPAVCAVCGDNDRPLVGWSFKVNMYGVVMMCTTCLSEAFEQVDIDTVKSTNDDSIMRNKRVGRVVKELKDGMDNLVDKLNRDIYLNGLGLSLDEGIVEPEPGIGDKSFSFLKAK